MGTHNDIVASMAHLQPGRYRPASTQVFRTVEEWRKQPSSNDVGQAMSALRARAHATRAEEGHLSGRPSAAHCVTMFAHMFVGEACPTWLGDATMSNLPCLQQVD